MTKFESDIRQIPYPIQKVYTKVSNMAHVAALRDSLPQDKVQDLTCDMDTLSFDVSPIGKFTLKVVEREPCKLVKLTGVDTPLPFNLWIQLVETGGQSCKLKLTFGAEINPFMKAIIQSPLQDGLNKLAGLLAVAEY